ncbi:MAG: 8-amino-7-oxononanoate synthase [Gammaproteobacteria bacterium]|nr:8-amino-7-oxononanoate synthase [Gammaproteobacteria bacterium]
MPRRQLDDASLQKALDARKAESLYRSRRVIDGPGGVELNINGREVIGFCSNDYLGLAGEPRIVEAMNDAAWQYGAGAGAAHLVNGHLSIHHELEERLADFVGYERALLFSTGYMANLGVAGALLQKGDAVYEDKLNHASLLDAGLSSNAKFSRYLHNDPASLEKKIAARPDGAAMIMTDGVFSMDGDFAPLPELAKVARKHKALLMVDDAHGLGAVGKHGRGSLEHFELDSDDVPVLVGTLGKAFGSFGAFVAGSAPMIETLIQHSRTYIYTTALPPAVAAASLTALGIIENEPERRSHLRALIRRFRAGGEAIGLNLMPSETAIQPIVVGSAEEALALSAKLYEKGLLVTAIRPPTVPAGTARLRVTLSAAHTEAQVDRLLGTLDEIL